MLSSREIPSFRTVSTPDEGPIEEGEGKKPFKGLCLENLVVLMSRRNIQVEPDLH